MSSIIGMYGAITGDTQNSIALVDIPQDGFIIGIDWDLNADLDASGEFVECELSFIATNQLSNNDVRGRLSSISTRIDVLTAVGTNAVSIQKWLGSFDISVSGGERMFVHAVSSTGVIGNVRCNLFVDIPGSPRRSARRR